MWPLQHCSLFGALAVAACLVTVLGATAGHLPASSSQSTIGIDSNAPSPAGVPHFAASTYGVLQSSGDRVSHAVQRILGVQGSLDELKEDLSTEYERWKGRKKELLAQRVLLENEIKVREAALLEQNSLREMATRLRGDLALAKHVTAGVNQTQKQKRAAWATSQEAYRKEIQELLDEINSTHETRQATLVAIHNNTNALQKREWALAAELMASNTTIAEFEEARAKHMIVTSREQNELLKEVAKWQSKKDKISNALMAQHKLQWEHDRLADQAREVVKRRNEIELDRLDCDAKIQQMNSHLTATSKAMQDDTAKLRRCQLMQADNAALQGKANLCRAAARAGNVGT